MKKRTKRLAALLLAATMVLTGCGGSSSGSGSGESAGTAAAGTEAAGTEAAGSEAADAGSASTDQGEPEKITVMIWDRGDAAPGTTAEDNALTDWIKEQVLAECNVEVEFIPVSRGDSDNKINVMMAGDTAPDLIYTYSRSLFLDYASKGGLTDLAPYVEEYGENIKTYVGDEILDLCNIDGALYGISATGTGLECNKHNYYIRKDWLDALGRDVPTTKQEFIDILYEFKEKDPGNVGDNLVPWAVSGKADTERHFTNFVFSYADEDQWDEKSMTMYEGYIKAIKPGTKEGYRILNQMYNDGIISPDFAVDTTEDKYKQDITNGYAGVCVEDGSKPIEEDWYMTLQSNVPGAEWVAINCFENCNGDYTRPATTRVQKTMMVPKTSEDKAEAVVKFLNWIVQPEIAGAIANTPAAEKDENGQYIPLTKEEKYELGYPNSTGDYNLLNRNFYDLNSKEEVVQSRLLTMPYLTEEYLSENYDTITTDIYYEPVFKKVLESVATYGTNLDKLVVEMQYKVVSAPVDQFDAVWDSEYKKLEEAGLNEVLAEREEYYNTYLAAGE